MCAYEHTCIYISGLLCVYLANPKTDFEWQNDQKGQMPKMILNYLDIGQMSNKMQINLIKVSKQFFGIYLIRKIK